MRVGMVGLGVMATPMVRRLARAGYLVLGYNRTIAKSAALAREVGMGVASTAREAAQGSDVVLSVLADDEAVRAVALGPQGILAGLAPGQVWVDCSTVSPGLSVELGEVAARGGAVRLEAPVSGSVPAVEAGTLVILAGGDAAALTAVEPVLAHLGTVRRVGGLGQALALKLAINMSIPAQLVAFAEGLVLAERAGLDRDRAIDLMLATPIASPMLRYRIPFAQRQPAEPWFTTEMMLKDVQLALGEAAARGIAIPMTELGAELLRRAALGPRRLQECAAVVNLVEELAGPAPGGPGAEAP